MKKIVLVIVLLFPVTIYCQQYERPGSATSTFVKIGVSAKAAGMADSYIAAVNGAEATYYNPAILASLSGLKIAANHNQWFASITHDFLAFSYNFGGVGAFGLSFTYLTTDEMKVRTPLQPEGTGETFYAGNYRIGLSYARQLTDHVNFGSSVYYINSSLYKDFEQHAFSADIAVHYRTGFHGFQFGVKISNFGSSITYVNEQYPLPITFSIGSAINALENGGQKLLLTFTILKPNDGQTLTRFGAEWDFQNVFFLRSGYKFNDDIATYTFGGGLRIGINGSFLDLDYAYSAYGLLGIAHRFGLNFSL